MVGGFYVTPLKVNSNSTTDIPHTTEPNTQHYQAKHMQYNIPHMLNITISEAITAPNGLPFHRWVGGRYIEVTGLLLVTVGLGSVGICTVV